MTLKLQLIEDMKQAMRARDQLRLDTIRYLLSQIKNWEIDHGQSDDREIQKIIAKEVKVIKEAMTEFARGERSDLVASETAKLAVLETYLPAPLLESELAIIIDQVLASDNNWQMGPAIKAIMERTQGRADGQRVAELVKQKLAIPQS